MFKVDNFYKYIGSDSILGLIPNCVYKYLDINDYNVCHFVDEVGHQYYINSDFAQSNFNKSGMIEENWYRRNSTPRTVANYNIKSTGSPVLPISKHNIKPFVATPTISPEEVTNMVNVSSIENNSVNHPNHYNKEGDVETIEKMIRIYGTEETAIWCKLNAFKYRDRAGLKGDAVEDINKALWCESKMKELLKK